MADRRDRPWDDERRPRREGGRSGGGPGRSGGGGPGRSRGGPERRGGDRPSDRPPSFDRDRPREFDRDRPRTFDRDRPRSFDRDRPREFDRDRPPGQRGFRQGRPGPQRGGFERRGFAERRPWQEPPQRRLPAPPPADLLAEDEELVAGRRPVEEAFSGGRDVRRLLVVPERRAALEALVMHATTLRIPVVEVEGGTLTSLTGFDGHQGVALAAAARPPADIDDILARARERGQPPFVLVLDSLEDPQNLGTLLRSAEACGVHGVVYPTRRSAPLTPAAIKASAGASEHLLLAAVDNLPAAMADLRGHGLRLLGSDEGAPLRYGEADMRGPLALVVGSEERGISGALRRRLDLLVRIPMHGRVASLNAAVAGSVLLFAAAEQRGLPEAGEEQQPPAVASPADATDEQPAVPTKRRRSTRSSAPAEAVSEVADDSAGDETAEGDELLPGEGPEHGPGDQST